MLRNIYIKEMKDILRDRRTLLLSVLLPILLLTGLTLFYEKMMSDDGSETYTLAISDAAGEEALELVSGIPNLKVSGYANPGKAVKDGKAHAAIEFSGQFFENPKGGEPGTAVIKGDSLSQNSAYVMSQLEGALNAYSDALVSERLTAAGVDPQVIQPIVVQVTEINNEDENAASVGILAGFLPMVITIAIASGAYPAASDLFAGEKDRKTMEALLMTPVSRIKLLFAKWLAISTIGMIAGIVSVAAIVLETIFLTEKLKAALEFGDNTFTIIAVTIVITLLFALFMGALQMVVSIIAKTVKEAQNYISPIMMLAIVPTLFLSGVGINELTMKHFLIPFVNIHALINELLHGSVNMENILLTLASTAVSIVIVFIFSRSLFLKDKWVLN
ncbi:ABC transporter permease [Bacillus infantis]|uniref:ABC transporter permease n=1 Tax=Bacillus infantis TaxID=324767 RepID=UPI003CF0FF5A